MCSASDEVDGPTVPEMRITQSQSDAGHAMLEISGELDLTDAADLHQRLLVLLHEQVREIVLDLSQLVFVDAAGIGAIVAAANLARRDGRRVVLAHPRPSVRRTLGLAHVEDLLPLDSE